MPNSNVRDELYKANMTEGEKLVEKLIEATQTDKVKWKESGYRNHYTLGDINIERKKAIDTNTVYSMWSSSMDTDDDDLCPYQLYRLYKAVEEQLRRNKDKENGLYNAIKSMLGGGL